MYKSIVKFLTTITFCFLAMSQQLMAEPQSQSKPKIHAIIVADTDASNIQKSIKIDLQNMKELVKSISEVSSMALQTYEFSGMNTNPIAIEKAVRQLSVGENDLVLFYFCGHGFRQLNQGGNPFPKLALHHYRRSLDLTKITQTLLKKNPRFVLAVTDNCNSYMDLKRENYKPQKPTKAPDYLTQSVYMSKWINNANTLFTESTGLVIATAALPGEFSLGTSIHGGLFTSSFVQSVNTEILNSRDPNWEALVIRASINTGERQTAQFFVIDDNVEAQNFLKQLKSMEAAQ